MSVSDKARYIRTWESLLREFLGWTPPRVHQWMAETDRARSLDDPESMIYHKPPQYWVVTTVIPQEVWDDLTTDERLELMGSIQEVLESGFSSLPPLRTCWAPYKRRVDQVVERYRAISRAKVGERRTAEVG